MPRYLLLQLYKSTHANDRFTTMTASALQNNLNLIPEWTQLEQFFDQQAS